MKIKIFYVILALCGVTIKLQAHISWSIKLRTNICWMATTYHRVQRKSFLQLAIRASCMKLAFTSTDIISTSPKTFWWAELISQFFCYLNSSKNITCPSGKLKTEFSSPIAKSTSMRAIGHYFLCTLYHQGYFFYWVFPKKRCMIYFEWMLLCIPATVADQNWQLLKEHRTIKNLTIFYKINSNIATIAFPTKIISLHERIHTKLIF